MAVGPSFVTEFVPLSAKGTTCPVSMGRGSRFSSPLEVPGKGLGVAAGKTMRVSCSVADQGLDESGGGEYGDTDMLYKSRERTEVEWSGDTDNE